MAVNGQGILGVLITGVITMNNNRTVKKLSGFMILPNRNMRYQLPLFVS